MTPTLIIAGRQWTVERVALRAQYGVCLYDTCTIQIHRGYMTQAELAATAIHEAIHASCPWLTEEHVEAVEQAAMQTLRAVGIGFVEEDE